MVLWTFALLLFILTLASLLFLWRIWLWEWEQAPKRAKIGFLILPCLPFTFLSAYNFLYKIDSIYYHYFLGFFGFFGLTASLVNIYRSLWAMLVKLSRQRRCQLPSPGILLLRITGAIVYTITAIILLFSIAFALITHLFEGSGNNYIADSLQQMNMVKSYQLASFFYFSFLTYFSLGHGDFIPRGSVILLFVYLEVLMGYINSGILIAYAFHIFTRLKRL